MGDRTPPPPSWPDRRDHDHDHDHGRRHEDDYAAVLADLRGDLRETRAEVVGRLDSLGQQLDGQVQRLEERIRDERHSRRSTDATVTAIADRLDKLDEQVDSNRVSLARVAAPAGTVALGVSILVKLLGDAGVVG